METNITLIDQYRPTDILVWLCCVYEEENSYGYTVCIIKKTRSLKLGVYDFIIRCFFWNSKRLLIIPEYIVARSQETYLL